ncbi:hypothetical protein ACTG9Q_07770 [Actinokineospora sp. 24-640]
MSAPQRPGTPPPWPPQQPYGRSGETERIPRVQEPRPDEPFHFEEPGSDASANPALTWALRIAGLVAIAVISGLVWAYLQDDPPANTADPKTSESSAPAGRFAFAPHQDMPTPKVDTDCAENSYDKVQQFFRDKPCVRLTRALYTTTPPGQDKVVYTAVTVVRMSSPELARELYDLARTDNTGNVNDPIRAELVTVEGIPRSLGGGGYDSQLNGADVIIVESDWAPTERRSDAEDQFLTEVSADAIRFGNEFAAQS